LICFQTIFYVLAKKTNNLTLSVSDHVAYRRFSHRSPCRFPPVAAQNPQQYSFCSSVKSDGGLECFLKEQHLHLVRTVALVDNVTKVGGSLRAPLRRISMFSSLLNTSRSPHRTPFAIAFHCHSMFVFYESIRLNHVSILNRSVEQNLRHRAKPYNPLKLEASPHLPLPRL
jgi:hypothetical protein